MDFGWFRCYTTKIFNKRKYLLKYHIGRSLTSCQTVLKLFNLEVSLAHCPSIDNLRLVWFKFSPQNVISLFSNIAKVLDRVACLFKKLLNKPVAKLRSYFTKFFLDYKISSFDPLDCIQQDKRILLTMHSFHTSSLIDMGAFQALSFLKIS